MLNSDVADVATLLTSEVIVGMLETRLLFVSPLTVCSNELIDDLSAEICDEYMPFAEDARVVRSPWTVPTAAVIPLTPFEAKLPLVRPVIDAFRFDSAVHNAWLL